jgi:hypothetical protein
MSNELAIDPKGLDFAVKVSTLSYPDMYPARTHVINHLYCVNGNGYDWFEGRLHEGTDEKTATVAKMLLNGDPETWIQKYVEDHDRGRFSHLYKIEEELRELSRKHGLPAMAPLAPIKAGFSIYPICQYACIANLPEDIRPDWLAGAEEALRLIETVPSYDEEQTQENRETWVPQIRELIRKRKEGK